MIKYRNRNDFKHEITSVAGEKIVPKYRLVVEENGTKHLIDDGFEDIYEPIQLGAEEAKISNIVARVSYGDMNALNQRAAQYIDATEMPDNLQDAMAAMAKAPELRTALEKLNDEKNTENSENKEVKNNAEEQ